MTLMPLFHRHRTIASSLNCIWRGPKASRWWLGDSRIIEIAQAVEAVAHQPLRSPSYGIRIIKHSDRKAVLLIPLLSDKHTCFVVKLFYLHHFRNKLKYYKFALDEAANLITASQRGLSTPEVLGYGHIYHTCGLVKAGAVILEYLPHTVTVGEVLEANKNDMAAGLQTVRQTIPVFKGLYKAACNHIDVNRGAILLSDSDREPNVFLLDFQHARFYEKPSTEILMFEAGYFGRECARWLSHETIIHWLAELLDEIEISGSDERARLADRFDYYFNADLSRKERKKIR